jgi:hypothetical protein
MQTSEGVKPTHAHVHRHPRLAYRVARVLNHPAPRMFIVLQLADVATTIIGLQAGAVELNALAVWFFTRFGTVLGLVLLKLLAAFIVIAVFVRAQLRRPEWWLHWLVLHLGNVFYAIVVFNNFQVITDLTLSVR